MGKRQQDFCNYNIEALILASTLGNSRSDLKIRNRVGSGSRKANRVGT